MKKRAKNSASRPVDAAELDPRLRSFIQEGRDRYRLHAMRDVVSAALAWDAEAGRVDQLHAARFSDRETTLRRMIEYAYDAIHPGPITTGDVEMAKRTMASVTEIRSRQRG
jgi:hypothetical protein